MMVKKEIDEKLRITAAVVEDEADAAELLTKYIRAFADEEGIVVDVKCFTDADSFLRAYSPGYAMVFMDIELGVTDGMTAAKELRKMDSVTSLIFVTNMAQFVQKGYEVDAIAYMLKPVAYADFRLKMKKAVNLWRSNSAAEIVVMQMNGFTRVSSDSLLYIEVMGHKLHYHLLGGKVIEASGTLSNIEESLKSKGFLRCNSCYLVNSRHVTSVKGYSVRVGDETLSISHPRRKSFMSSLMDLYWGGGG